MISHSIPQLFAVDPACDRTPALLAQQTHLFWQLLEQSADATLLWHDQRLVFCNQAAVDLLGYAERAELLQQTFWQLSPTQQPSGHDSREQALLMINIAAQTGHHRFEWWYEQADGEVLPVEITLTAVTLDANTTIFQAVCRDIRDRKQAEAALQASEASFRQILDAIADLVLVKGEKSKIVWANQAFRDYYGMSNEELQGLIDAPFNEPDYTQQYVKDDAHVFMTGKRLEVEEPVTRHDGEVRLFNTIKAPIRDRDGSVTMTVGVSRDITDQRAVQNDVRQSQKLLQALIDNTNACIFIKDYRHQDGNYILVNKQFEQIFGRDRSEIEGKSDYDFFPKEAADQFYETDLEVLRNRQLVQMEEDVPQADGMHIYLSTKFPLVDDDGEPYALCGIATDITARKQAEEQLLESRQLLRHVIDNIPQAIFWKDRRSVYLGCNRNFAQAAGLAHPRDIIGLTDSDLPWTPEEAEFYRSNDQQVMDSGQAQYHLLESQQQSDGKQIWCDTNKIPLFDADGQVMGLLGTFEDITARKQIEEDLHESKQLLELVLDAMPQYTFWKSKDSVYLGCNRRFAQLTGVGEPEHIFGKTDYDLPFSQAEADWYIELDRRVMTSDQPIYNVIEPQQHHKDGRQRWSETNKIPLHDQDGNVIGILGTFQDVTERIEAQEALQRSEAELRQKAEELEHLVRELRRTQAQLVQTEKMSSLGQLVAGIAHEINNPVNFIHGNVGHARAYIQDLIDIIQAYQFHYPNPHAEVEDLIEAVDLEFLLEDLPNLLSSMQVGADRIRDIVASLRTFSRLDEAEVKDVDIHAGIDSTLMILHNRLKAKSDRPEIAVHKHYGALPDVECYAGQLNQVFMNILVNAIDALEERDRNRSLEEMTDSPSQLWITTQVTADQAAIRIAIRDNGPGIPDYVLPRIFDPFFTTKPVGKGTGLGMSISYQVVVDKHGGRLTCSSVVGEGSEFVIEIPVRRVRAIANPE
ncbi:MAG: PAS domain-containing sensor histidine kinase [Thainema sp.]